MSDASKISDLAAPAEGSFDAGEVCRYVADLCAELRAMSRKHNLPTLGYLLDMARLEAERTAKELRPGSWPVDGR